MVSFTCDAVFQPINQHIGAPDRDVSAIIGVLRFSLIGDCGETSSGDVQRFLVNGKSSDIRDLVEVPDDRSVHIHIAVFIDDKDICLRRSIVLVQPKADIVLYMGIGDSDQTGSRQVDVDFLLIPLKRRYPFKFKRLQAGTDHKNRCITILHFRIVNDEGRRAEIGVGLDDRCALLSSNVVCGPLVGFHQKAMLISECMACGNSVYIIGFAVAFGTKVTITNQSAGFKFKDILWGYIYM